MEGLFEVPRPASPTPGSMDYRQEVACLVGQMLKTADGDRWEIAARMSRLTGKDISKYMLDAYAAEGREEFNLPFYLAPVLEVASASHVLAQWFAEKRGGSMLMGEEVLMAELGKIEAMEAELKQQKAMLKGYLRRRK